MNKQQIIDKLVSEIETLRNTIDPLPSNRFFTRIVLDKWSVAENVRHLTLAVRPLNLAFSLPNFIIRVFGKPTRAAASYDEVVARYQKRLREGAKASLPYQPSKSYSVAKEELISALAQAYQTFAEKVKNTPEEKLDLYYLPHPILGRITLREMLYFTVYHVGHHHKAIQDRLKS